MFKFIIKHIAGFLQARNRPVGITENITQSERALYWLQISHMINMQRFLVVYREISQEHMVGEVFHGTLQKSVAYCTLS